MEKLVKNHHHQGFGVSITAPASHAFFNIVPHDQVVGSPSPRKLKLDSDKTAVAITKVRFTKTGPTIFNKICLNSIFLDGIPKHLAASINCISDIFIVEFLVTLANDGHENKPITIATLFMEDRKSTRLNSSHM